MTLYRETPCEHGFLTDHQKSSEGRKDIQYPWCPGGSRTEVTIDYETGSQARYEEYAKDAASYPDNHPWSWEDLPPIPKAKFRQDAIVTINAALGITVGRPGWMKAKAERESASTV